MLRTWAQAQREVANADGDHLEQIGALIQCERYLSEGDEEYRARMLEHVNSYSGAGTIPGIVQAFAAYLDIEESQLSISEAYEDAFQWNSGYYWNTGIYWSSRYGVAGYFTLTIELANPKYGTWNTPSRRARLKRFLDDLKAAGTRGRVVIVDRKLTDQHCQIEVVSA